MKKPFRYDELSDTLCSVVGCRRRLKKNVIARVRRAAPLVCYGHWLLARNSFQRKRHPEAGQRGAP